MGIEDEKMEKIDDRQGGHGIAKDKTLETRKELKFQIRRQLKEIRERFNILDASLNEASNEELESIYKKIFNFKTVL